jgi:DNA-binding response OmpR family regulator
VTEEKVLVVDDEVLIRNMLEKAFSRAGYAVRCAESAEQALEILKDETYQTMFLDLKLPGMNGIELCMRIRKDFPMALIYAITGYASLFELADCREAGFDDYFTKPFDLGVVLKAAQDAFEKMERWKKREYVQSPGKGGTEDRPV